MPACGALMRTVSLLPGRAERYWAASSVGSSSRLTSRVTLPLPPEVVMLSGPRTPAGTSMLYRVSLPVLPDRPVSAAPLAIGVASGAQSTSHGGSIALATAAAALTMPGPIGCDALGATVNG